MSGRRSISLRGLARFAAWAALVAATGCYDSAQMTEAHHDAASVPGTVEVDLGAYHITLPIETGEMGGGAVNFHVYARVDRAELSPVTKALEERHAELRSNVLLAVRAMDAVRFQEPKLTSLRAELRKVIDRALDKHHVADVGFYQFSFTAL